jgi:hypothetical protein
LRLSLSPRGPAHDGDSQISDADCLIRLDNFRSAISSTTPGDPMT